jgi:hypothetical protein
MSLQTENRDIPESGSADSKVDYQRFEHPEVTALLFALDNVNGISVPANARYSAYVRIYMPDIRVVSRIACVFQPLNPNDKPKYNLSVLKNQITAYRCINAGSVVARVGEIIGKNGVPYEFPKSDIEGIAFQCEDDCPFVDVDLNLGFPGVAGKWCVYYHATSNNKMKRQEWEGYISRVTMNIMEYGGDVRFTAREE